MLTALTWSIPRRGVYMHQKGVYTYHVPVVELEPMLGLGHGACLQDISNSANSRGGGPHSIVEIFKFCES